MTELGQRLKESREAKNISLDELQRITKIQKRYLQAIENGDFKAMPGTFYARAFIRQYAEAVNLDPNMLFDQFQGEVPKNENDEIPTRISRVQQKQTSVSSKSSKLMSILPKLLVGVLILGIAVSIWVFLQNRDTEGTVTPNQNINNEAVERELGENVTLEQANQPDENPAVSENNENPSGQQNDQQTTDKIPVEPPKQSLNLIEPNASIPVYELTNTEAFSVKITSVGRSYVGIENGKGKSFFGGEILEGNTQTFDFSAESEIEFNIGRASDINIQINGEPFTFPQDPNEKVHQKFKILFNKE